MPGTLYVVATPIGNLEDMSPRAARILAEADLVAAEDTRVSGLLLERFGIRAKLVSCHKFNERARIDTLLRALQEGRNIALISDAGTPCISDPGSILVEAAAAAGIDVVGVSGPCAAVTALSISGFPCGRFQFIGFLPRTGKELRQAFCDYAERGIEVLVGYESPNRILAAMEELRQVLPSCRVCLCNDLTKRYERVYRGSPAEVLQQLAENPNASKGEYTLVLYSEPEKQAQAARPALSPEAALTELIVARGLSLKQAVAALAADGGVPRNEAYAASLRLKRLFCADGGA